MSGHYHSSSTGAESGRHPQCGSMGRFVSAEVSNSIGGERETNGAAGSSQLVITTMYLFPSVITM